MPNGYNKNNKNNRYTKEYPVTTISGDGAAAETNCPVAAEDSIKVFINGTRAASILASPAAIKELAVGYVICEGIAGFDETTLCDGPFSTITPSCKTRHRASRTCIRA